MVTLYVGNRNYSSWSRRGWLAVKLAGVPRLLYRDALAAAVRP